MALEMICLHFFLALPPLILAFPLSHTSTCRFCFLGLILVLSAHTQSGWGWLQKLKSIALSGAEYLIAILIAFPLNYSYTVLALSFGSAMGAAFDDVSFFPSMF